MTGTIDQIKYGVFLAGQDYYNNVKVTGVSSSLLEGENPILNRQNAFNNEPVIVSATPVDASTTNSTTLVNSGITNAPTSIDTGVTDSIAPADTNTANSTTLVDSGITNAPTSIDTGAIDSIAPVDTNTANSTTLVDSGITNTPTSIDTGAIDSIAPADTNTAELNNTTSGAVNYTSTQNNDKHDPDLENIINLINSCYEGISKNLEILAQIRKRLTNGNGLDFVNQSMYYKTDKNAELNSEEENQELVDPLLNDAMAQIKNMQTSQALNDIPSVETAQDISSSIPALETPVTIPPVIDDGPIQPTF